MKKLILILIILLFVLTAKGDAKASCSPADMFRLRCEVICEQDGDEKGFVVGGECFCANRRDIKRVPTRLNRNITTNSQEKEKEKGIYEY